MTASDGIPGRPLRLGYLIDSMTTGGAERLVVTFADTVRTFDDVDLTVFVLNDKETPFLEQLRELGTRVVCLPGRGLGDMRRFARLLRALRTHEIDYLHAHLSTATTLGSIAAKIMGLPFATTIHNVRPSVRRVSNLRRIAYRTAVRRPGIQRIAVGQAVAEAMRGDVGDLPRIVIPNAFPPSVVAPPGAREETRQALGFEDGDFVLTAIGLLIPQKGYPDLLAAFRTVIARRPDAVLQIAGAPADPAHAKTVYDLAEALDFGDRLRFLGLRRDVPALLAATDLFVSASHWEGAPVALLEALANGTACCVTDVGENALVLEGTEAAIVPPHDPDRLASAILDMMGDSDRRVRAAGKGRARANACYSSAAWAERLVALYQTHVRTGKPVLAGDV